MAAEQRTLTLYRADGRPPELIKEKGGMLTRESRPLKDVKQLFCRDPRAFEESHVRSNLPYLVSTATDEECGGLANDRFLYRITIPGLYRFEQTPPARSRILKKPVIYANAPSFEAATMVLMETAKQTGEVDFFDGIPLRYIEACRAPRETHFRKISD
ncbi:hypothetical protein ACH4UM_22570 [Streptomyces sp. NPDC020801]|uniref:hypothetical protein n=1 Tax=unclassified Streptomyces TaxID=2593676 RepID=UPI0037BDE8BF